MTQALCISGWSRYMHADCKRSASMPWVKCPTSHSGLAYLELMDHPNGMAHFAAWILILQVAAKNPTADGMLITDSGRILGARELALKTKGNRDFFDEAIKRLLAIGWLEEVEYKGPCKQSASNLQAECVQPACLEERRGEDKEDETITHTHASAHDTEHELCDESQTEKNSALVDGANMAPMDLPPRLRDCYMEIAQSEGGGQYGFKIASIALHASRLLFRMPTEAQMRETYKCAVSAGATNQPANQWPDFRKKIQADQNRQKTGSIIGGENRPESIKAYQELDRGR